MTNFTETIKTVKNLDELQTIIDEKNALILDTGDEYTAEEISAIDTFINAVNVATFNAFCNGFFALLETDRKTAFMHLVTMCNYAVVSFVVEDNGTVTTANKAKKFKFADLEKAYQLHKSTENRNGKIVPNGGVSVFGSLRFYTVCDAFVRNLFLSNVEVDEDKKLNLERVKVDGDTIFTDKDGECFTSNSKQALKKQLNVLVKFFGLDVEMFREDVAPLRMVAQKVKIDNKNNVSVREVGKRNKKTNTKDNNILKFADVLFAVIACRVRNVGVKFYTADDADNALDWVTGPMTIDETAPAPAPETVTDATTENMTIAEAVEAIHDMQNLDIDGMTDAERLAVIDNAEKLLDVITQ